MSAMEGAVTHEVTGGAPGALRCGMRAPCTTPNRVEMPCLRCNTHNRVAVLLGLSELAVQDAMPRHCCKTTEMLGHLPTMAGCQIYRGYDKRHKEQTHQASYGSLER